MNDLVSSLSFRLLIFAMRVLREKGYQFIGRHWYSFLLLSKREMYVFVFQRRGCIIFHMTSKRQCKVLGSYKR
jgi:hypothetical protein